MARSVIAERMSLLVRSRLQVIRRAVRLPMFTISSVARRSRCWRVAAFAVTGLSGCIFFQGDPGTMMTLRRELGVFPDSGCIVAALAELDMVDRVEQGYGPGRFAVSIPDTSGMTGGVAYGVRYAVADASQSSLAVDALWIGPYMEHEYALAIEDRARIIMHALSDHCLGDSPSVIVCTYEQMGQRARPCPSEQR